MSVSAVATPHTFQMSDHLSDDIPFGNVTEKAAPKKDLAMYGGEEPSFWDFLDVINPLQHIPIVNNLYREITGDQIGVGARLAGGALFGGPIGLVASAVNCAIEEQTGHDAGGHVLALLRDDEAGPSEQAPAPTAIAMAEPARASQTPPPAVQPVKREADAAIATPAASPMIFTADGDVVSTAPPVKAEAVKPVPLVGQPPARFMPAPARTPGVTARNSPPPISVPVSNSGSRSNMPITGRDPVANGLGPNPAMMQRILESQGRKSAELPPASGGDPAGSPSQDWFAAAMTNGLDKYEQAAKFNRRGDQTDPPIQ